VDYNFLRGCAKNPDFYWSGSDLTMVELQAYLCPPSSEMRWGTWLTDTSPFLEPEKHIQTEFQIRKQERA